MREQEKEEKTPQAPPRSTRELRQEGRKVKRRNRKLTTVFAAVIAAAAMAAIAASASAQINIERFDVTYLDANGDPATQAGGHPDTNNTEFDFETILSPGGPNGPFFEPKGVPYPNEAMKTALTELPPGLVGNPVALPQCTAAQFGFARTYSIREGCPAETQVGIAVIRIGGFLTKGKGVRTYQPLYNLEPPPGTPALFGFNTGGIPAFLSFTLRTGGDYGLTAANLNTPATGEILGVKLIFWGIPADPAHDVDRGYDEEFGAGCADPTADPSRCHHPSSAPLTPFLSLPTSCVGSGPNNAVETNVSIDSWDDLGSFAHATSFSHDNSEPTPNPVGFSGCNAVDFSPSIEARPTTNVADAPSGLDVDIHLPQHESCNPTPPVSCETAEAHLQDFTLNLPQGVTLNPSGANGLGSCSEAEFGYTSTDPDGTIHTTPGPATCPDSSKLGAVTVDTPLIDHPLKGSVFLADPHANPFDSLVALYISVDDPQTGIVIKLAGEVNADPVTGQLSATFQQNPQQPFAHFLVHFFGGAGGALRTPALCGSYKSTTDMTPWTTPEGEDKNPEDSWQITQGPNAGPCVSSEAQLPNTPSFDAGTVSPISAAYSPVVVNLRREDGSQAVSQVTVTTPPGLIGKLAGITPCSESALAAAAGKTGQEEKANPSCPASSRVGTVEVAAGAGPAPYSTPGIVYLTGPYKGAPLGFAIITPATAGPFDLGTVVVRAAVFLDSKTTQITAKADPLPTILQGIPLDIRQALIKLDRDQFTLTGTSCDPLEFTGALTTTLGSAASLSNRYQLAECSRLGFQPKISLALKGGTKRTGHPTLVTTLEPRPGDANLASISVALPPTELLDQNNIGTVCTRVQFAADQCPPDSIYGTASVSTPLVDYELTGNVYLRSSDNPLPDLVPDFRGPASQPIRIEAAGRTDTVKGALRNTFDLVPDAPFTKLVVTLPGGKGGLIQNSRDICAQKFRGLIKYTGQNGLAYEQRPVVRANCPKGKRHRRHAHRRALR
jgi:hypothetical protein